MSDPIDPHFVELFVPKLLTAIREGYGLSRFRKDAVAGLTVAIVALPLAMAIGIASGATPSDGIVTAIVAGFVISALGGSRFQIGGPTAAFIVVIFHTIERHGYDGMLAATIMAGLILIAFGLLRLGTFIKYIPYPVVVGFTAGIALSIFVSEIKDLLGLEIQLSADFLPKISELARALPDANLLAVGVSFLALAIILVLRRYRPKWPGFLIAVALASAIVALLDIDVPTVGSAFGGVPAGLPTPSVPGVSLSELGALIPDAITIAFLAGIESLLSAVIADGMTGRRHRSNAELVAQGIANIASGIFGGLSATGAIARTATNIRAGAQTPVAGMLHAVFILAFVLVGAWLLAYLPLAALAAILAVVAWNIAEFGHVRRILSSAALGDRAVLATTFLLTVLVDLTTAIEVGVVLAALLFMHRMANVVSIERGATILDEDRPDTAPRDREILETPERHDVVVYRINGPFFFGATEKFSSTLNSLGRTPRKFVLELSGVPFVDTTAATTLRSFVESAHRHRTSVSLVGVRPPVRLMLEAAGIDESLVTFEATVEAATADRTP
jgi:sulfate permease, SulP family